MFSLVFFISIIFAQQNEPIINFAKVKHDYGNLQQKNGPAKYVFRYTNTGGKPVIISDVKSSCGCTTPSWSKAPIAPGQKGFVEVVYDPRNRPGRFSKTITITSNASNSPVVLSISGNVLEKQNSIAETYPQKVGDLLIDKVYLNFGNIYNDETKVQTFKIYNPTTSDMKLSAYKSKLDYATVTFSPTVLKPKQSGKITVKFEGAKVNDWDYVRGLIYLNINGTRITSKRLQVSAIVKERFTQIQRMSPPEITFDSKNFDFGTIKEGDVIEHVFTFKNTGKTDLIIRKTKTSCGCTAVSLDNKPIKPGQSGSIKVVFNSTHKINKQTKIVTVITNCPDLKFNKVILKITGNVTPKDK